MKKSIIIAVLLLSVKAIGQEASVEKSMFGTQIGLIGAWVYNETKLTDQFVLRSEIGLMGYNVETVKSIDENTISLEKQNIAIPEFIISPRWYYNLKKRASQGKRIDGNSANFLAINVNYVSSLFTLPKLNNGEKVIDRIMVVPQLGIRRGIGKRFYFEAGIGAGYALLVGRNSKRVEDKEDFVISARLRLGYRF